jgi:outer membrane protein assembly factor BamB
MRRIALVVALCCLPTVSASDWPQWLGPTRDGVSPEAVQPWQGELKTLWHHSVGEGHSSPIVARGKVFLHSRVRGTSKEEVQAWDAVSGKMLWRQEYDRGLFNNEYGNGPRSTPLYNDGLLYTLGVTGILTCWEADSGSQKWQHNLLQDYNAANLFFGVSTSPMVVGDLLLVMVGGKNASIVALEKKSGKPRWQVGSDKAAYASPMLTTQGNKQLAVFLTAAHLLAVDPQEGKIVWEAPLRDLLSESSSTPVRASDYLFATSVTYGGVLYKLVEKEGRPNVDRVWHERKLTCYFGTPIAIGDHLYAVTGSLRQPPQANLHCVEIKTGKVIWTKEKVGKYHATLLRVQDRLLMLEEGGDLVLIEPTASAYKELARAKVCSNTWAHPALSDGRFYVRDGNELRCVVLGK